MPTATATKLISLDRAIEAAKKVIAGKEDYVYPQRDDFPGGCSYTNPDGSPSCVVGYMVAALRPKTFKELVHWEAEHLDSFSASGLVSNSAYDNDDHANVKIFEQDAEDFLNELQDNQDSGRTWGYALESALAVVGRD